MNTYCPKTHRATKVDQANLPMLALRWPIPLTQTSFRSASLELQNRIKKFILRIHSQPASDPRAWGKRSVSARAPCLQPAPKRISSRFHPPLYRHRSRGTKRKGRCVAAAPLSLFRPAFWRKPGPWSLDYSRSPRNERRNWNRLMKSRYRLSAPIRASLPAESRS